MIKMKRLKGGFGLWKILLTTIVTILFLAAFTAIASAATIYVPDDYGTIQGAVDAADPGDTIIVRDGTYTENINVNKSLTIRSENGSASTTVQASNSNDHVFVVTADYVNISGFTATGATATGPFKTKAGIKLAVVQHCNISGNNCSNNDNGIYLVGKSNNNLSGNTASYNHCGIYLDSSSNNNLSGNTASNNYHSGIYLDDSSNNNKLSGNNANSNIISNGIILRDSSNNNLSGNTASYNYWGIHMSGLSNNNNLSGNTASYNYYGIRLSSSNNKLTSNTVSNNNVGIELFFSNNNLIYNNYFNNTNNAYDNRYNIWHITKEAGTNIMGGPYLGGNYWSDYSGKDLDGDGLGDTLLPYNSSGHITNGGDDHPLVIPVFNCTCGDICVKETGWWRDGDAFIASGTPIQDAINNAIAGETICVKDGTYNENVDVGKRVTIKSENGAASTTVQASNSSDHVFEITADYVNISGFTATGATEFATTGIFLYNADYCKISGNNCSNNYLGIWLDFSSNNNLTSNTASYNNYGIYLSYSSNNNLTSNTANSNDYYGIYLAYSSNNNTLTSNTASYNYDGIYLYSSSNSNTLTSNTASYNYDGITLYASSSNLIYNNYFNNTNNAWDYGNNIWNSTRTAGTYNIIGGNYLGGNYWSDYAGTDTDGDGLGDTLLPYNSNGKIINGGDDHPLVYTALNCTCGDICVTETGWWRDGGAFNPSNTPIQHAIDNAIAGDTICVKDGTYNENVDVDKRLTIRSENGSDSTIVQAANSDVHVFAVTADYVNISGFTVTGASNYYRAGIYLGSDTDHCNISGNNCSNNYYGIRLYYSSNNNLSDNNAYHNSRGYGIYLGSSSNNNLSGNTASNNAYGIELSSSCNSNTLTSNIANSNSRNGIYLGYSSNNSLTSNTANSNYYYGIYLAYSSNNNTLTSNTASDNSVGILLSFSSNSNTLTSNTVNSNNDYGITLYASSSNLIYNNYFNNTNNAWDYGNNNWNITKEAGKNIIGGPYLGGNYWSDYRGKDLDEDGLGDTLLPYNSSGNIQTGGDWHPLTTVGYAADLVITEKWLCWPDNCRICYNVTNIGTGTAPACHNTTLYVDGVAVAHDHVPVDLAPNASYISGFVDYTWQHTPPSDNITVCADNNETIDELDETNNCLTNIWMCGDVNCDGKVTMSDVRKVFNRYLDPNYPLDLPWAADVNGDGKVTMSDVRKVFNRYLDPGYELNCCCGV